MARSMRLYWRRAVISWRQRNHAQMLDPHMAGESVPFVSIGIALLLLSASHLYFRSDADGRQTCMGVVWEVWGDKRLCALDGRSNNSLSPSRTHTNIHQLPISTLQYPVYLSFGVSGNSFLVICSIITNLGPHSFPKGLKQWPISGQNIAMFGGLRQDPELS